MPVSVARRDEVLVLAVPVDERRHERTERDDLEPLLAVEVAGRYEGEAQLREKAQWYLGAGVRAVWVVLPRSREVIVVTAVGERRHAPGEPLPADPSLPGLAPMVDELFVQISQPPAA